MMATASRFYGTRVSSCFVNGVFFSSHLYVSPLFVSEPSCSPGSRYASDLSPDQRDALLDVVRVRPHPQIGPEVRRELVNASAKGEPRTADVEMSSV